MCEWVNTSYIELVVVFQLDDDVIVHLLKHSVALVINYLSLCMCMVYEETHIWMTLLETDKQKQKIAENPNRNETQTQK